VRHLYVLFFIELGGRRVHLARCTPNPSGGLGPSTGAQPQLNEPSRAEAFPDPRSRQQVHRRLPRAVL
jgi:hypothetical protein